MKYYPPKVSLVTGVVTIALRQSPLEFLVRKGDTIFSVFRKVSAEQDVVLQELNEDELSQVAGGQAHKHHHKHPKHHHKHQMHHKIMTPPQKMMPTPTTTPTTTMPGTQVFHQHW